LKNLSAKNKIAVDVIILCKNPKLKIAQLQNNFDFKEIVFDSSNPLWKIDQWKKDCDSLHLRFHSVPQQGAFVMDITSAP
jgi:competence protein ComEC